MPVPARSVALTTHPRSKRPMNPPVPVPGWSVPRGEKRRGEGEERRDEERRGSGRAACPGRASHPRGPCCPCSACHGTWRGRMPHSEVRTEVCGSANEGGTRGCEWSRVRASQRTSTPRPAAPCAASPREQQQKAVHPHPSIHTLYSHLCTPSVPHLEQQLAVQPLVLLVASVGAARQHLPRHHSHRSSVLATSS